MVCLSLYYYYEKNVYSRMMTDGGRMIVNETENSSKKENEE